MKISDAAKAANVGIETIRFYERKGLVDQPRKPDHGGYRNYSRDDVSHIRFIKKAQKIGFTLKEIEELLYLNAQPDGDCAVTRGLAETKLVEVSEKIANLQKIRAALLTLVRSCPGSGSLDRCSILHALNRD